MPPFSGFSAEELRFHLPRYGSVTAQKKDGIGRLAPIPLTTMRRHAASLARVLGSTGIDLIDSVVATPV